MSRASPPPTYDQIADEDGQVKLSWLQFFDNVYQGDNGNNWTPTFVSLTVSGTPTITGRYYRITRNLIYFSIRIVPATNTTSTAGTTYCDNFPFTVAQDGACLSVAGNSGGSSGMVTTGNNRIYVPGWSAVTIPLTIIGLAEVT